MLAKTLLSAAAFAAVAAAHQQLLVPKPQPSSLTKNPLAADGSDFPCHQQALGPSAGSSTPMNVGDQQVLALDTGAGANTATHGGGSCQISVTYETDPTKVKDPSNWHVIYSVLGGCPSITQGNLPSASYCSSPGQLNCINNITYSLPKELPNGAATLSWTWSNTIGNREFYMGCANIDVSGGASDQSQLSQLPQMYVGNLQVQPVQSCTNAEQSNVQYPDPGKYTTSFTPTAAAAGATYAMAAPSGNCGPSSGSGSGSGGGSSGGSSSGATGPTGVNPPPGAAPTGGSVGSMPYPTGSPGGSGSGSGSSSGSGSGSGSSSGSGSGSGSSSGAGSGAGSGSGSGSTGVTPPSTGSGAGNGTCGDSRVSCPTPGAVVCMSSTQFGICDIDNCATPQALAAGTSCAGGAVAKIKKLGKRAHGPSRHAHGHSVPW